MNLLIVEDEAPIRNGLTHLIPWHELGVDQILTAGNGEQAFHLCEHFIPDVLLTDIRMPKMNGLELARKIRVLNPGIKIIFLSSYDEKEYYKAAIKLHAIDFVDKPTRPEVLTAAVQLAVTQLKNERLQNQTSENRSSLRKELQEFLTEPVPEHRFSLLENWLQDSEAALSYRMLYCKFAPADQIPAAQDTESKIEDVIRKNFYQGICVCCHHAYYALIADRMTEKEPLLYRSLNILQHELLRSLALDTLPFLAASAVFSDPALLRQAVLSVEQVASQLFLSGYGSIAIPISESADRLSVSSAYFMEKFGISLLFGCEAETLTLLQEFLKAIRSLSYHSVLHARSLCDQMTAKLKERSGMRSVGTGIFPRHPNRTADSSDFETADAFETELIRQIRLYYLAINREETDSLVTQICTYIIRHHASFSIGISEIAESVHLSATYVCHLFKKERNETISSYLNLIRVERSKAYLLDENMPLYEIASRVGYSDPNYYMRIFKKITGIPPSVYRAQYGSDSRLIAPR